MYIHACLNKVHIFIRLPYLFYVINQIVKKKKNSTSLIYSLLRYESS